MVSLSDIFDESNDESKAIASALAESANPAQDLVDDLIFWLENVKTELPRKPGLHASSLWKTCARKVLLEQIHADHLVIEEIKAGSRMTFDMGHALHDLIQNVYLGPFGRLFGNWKCLNCQKIVANGTMPKDCPSCSLPWRNGEDGTRNLVYDEPFVHDEKLKYCGHCDGILLDRTGTKKRVFEFKSKSASQFRTLRRPESSHVIQVHAYMNGLGLDEAIILYWDKGSQCDWSRDSDGGWHAGIPHLKSFLVPFDKVLWAAMTRRIEEHHAASKLLPTVTTDDVMKFKRVCTHSGCDLAKACAVSTYCFALSK